MKQTNQTFLFLFLLAGGQNLFTVMPSSEQGTLKEKIVNIDSDTGQEITTPILTREQAGQELLDSLGSSYRYFTEGKAYKYKTSGNPVNSQKNRRHRQAVRQLDGSLKAEETVHINENKFSDNFEALRELCIEPIKNNQIALTVAAALTAFVCEFSHDCNGAISKSGKSCRYCFGISAAVLTACSAYFHHKKIAFYKSVEESEYLEAREEGGLGDEYDSLEKEIPNPITGANILQSIILSVGAGFAAYYAKGKMVQSTVNTN